MSNGSEKVFLFDYNFAKKKEENLDYTPPILELSTGNSSPIVRPLHQAHSILTFYSSMV